jgi:Uma2 family endonuclease
MSTPPKPHLSPEEYLELERKAEFKSEYFQGEMVAMTGFSLVHNLVAGNTLAVLWQQLRPGPCEVLPSNMRLHVRETGLFTYPDVVAYCGEPQLLDEQMDTLLNPILIVEVLSPSTEAYDRGRKFHQYQLIESLQDYLMVCSDRVHADLHTREPAGRWRLSWGDRMEDTLELPSVGCLVKLSDLYEGVDL